MSERGPDKPALFISHPIFHQPAFGKLHPLSTSRQGAVVDLCRAMGWLPDARMREASLASVGTLRRFHADAYLDALATSCATMLATPEVRQRYNLGTMECPIFDGLWERARAAVGGSVLAAELALGGHLVFHPAGGTHHGRSDRASGFCYLNDPVFAILGLLDAGLQRVLYVDLDAHHGDGVEAAFEADARVLCVSLHEAGRWPGTGPLGASASGHAINVPLPKGINDAEYLLLLTTLRQGALARFKPQAVVVTCGADCLAGDPLSSMALSNSALWDAVDLCVALAPRAIILGGGGYNPWTTVRAWAGLWARLSCQPIPATLPPEAQRILEALASDLIDDEDRLPAWTTTIADHTPPGDIRPEILAIAAAI